ncbi:MAG: phosphomannomutase/phosphoglucomutase [Actinomycetota bacterium]
MDLDAIFKAYDVRGIYPDQLDEEVAHGVGRAVVELTKAKRVVVARDMRSSSEPLSTAFISGAMTQGADVVDLGLASTDMLYFASGKLGLPGAVFTASHNPARYNGIKLCRSGAVPIGEETGLLDIKGMVAAGSFPTGKRPGSVERGDLTQEYVDHLIGLVDVSAIKGLTVAVDAANGMGGLTVPMVFDRLPVELIPLYFELDGNFPNHPADPIQPENLKDLIRTVVDSGADIGLAFDGDADRVFLVDEKGEPVSGSLTAAIVARTILQKHPGEKVIYSLTCSRLVPEIIRENDGEPIRSRVGHSFIKAVMADTGAIFGGEHSGHYYFRDHYRADCGLLAALNVLEVLSVAGRPLSEVLAPLRSRYWNSGEINSEVADKIAAMDAVAQKYPKEQQDWTDGLTIEFEDWWFNIRPSNTEPLLRLNVEARDQAAGEGRRDEILAIIRGVG